MSSQCANPQFLEWIKEWYDKAKERNAKSATTYKKAYESLKVCPLTFNHPSEAQQLHGLGPKLCDQLTEKLKDHCSTNDLPMPKASRKSRKRLTADEQSLINPEHPVKKPRKPKPYVPSLRSGPYAIILALSLLPEDSTVGLTKGQLIERAQEHCDSSFTAPTDASKFYTAWNSMKILIEKDLVYEKGRPLRRYLLSDEGWEVAMRINNVKGGLHQLGETTTHDVAPSRVAINSFMDFDDYEIEDDDVPKELPLARGSFPVLEDNEHFDTPGLGGAGHRIGGEMAGRFAVFPSSKRTEAIAECQKAFGRDFIEILSSPEPPIRPEVTNAHQAIGSGSEVSKPDIEPLITDKRSNTQTQRTSTPLKNTLNPNFQSICLEPGTFTVHLVIDSREVRTKNDRDYIEDELVKKDVSPLVRPLELGDFFWVAKCKDPNLLARHGEEGDEIALDWIVERKRLDDLVGSIKDGRFHEQKFRLCRSGVKNVIYIIEEFTMSSESILNYHEAIQTAIASTQVVNGYFVKKTQKLDDTIRYLARMTGMLKSLYETGPLHIIPTPHLESHTYLPLLTHLRRNSPETSYNITYSSFASLTSKSDSLTLRDIFLKMLMCTRGVTGEKALEIQKRWKTPRALAEALESCEGSKERGPFLDSNLGGQVGRKKLGKAVCGKVAEVWGEAQI